ncbi:MAG: hypothetical protein ACKO47_04725 [Alphaproteobacteria bacterium]
MKKTRIAEIFFKAFQNIWYVLKFKDLLMIISKFLTLSISIIFFVFNQIDEAKARKTSFDGRDVCEANSGVWREFGNGCGDECYSKFDEFAVCSQARTYACDCGKGKCWNEEKCVAVLEYRKTFDEIRQQEAETMSQAKRKRIAQAKKYQQDLIKRMIENRSGLTVAKYSENGDSIVAHNNFSNNNYADVYNKKYPEVSQGRNYITNFDERYANSGLIDQNRMKSIQYLPKQPEIPVEPEPVVVQNANPSNNQQILTNPNQNQQLVIQQQGMQDQVVKNDQPAIVGAVFDDPKKQNTDPNLTLPSPEAKIVNNQPKPVETYQVPSNLNNAESKKTNSSNNELQLPVVELPR